MKSFTKMLKKNSKQMFFPSIKADFESINLACLVQKLKSDFPQSWKNFLTETRNQKKLKFDRNFLKVKNGLYCIPKILLKNNQKKR